MYEQQTKKLLAKREALEKRMREDDAEIDKINAKLNEMQLARMRDTFGLDQKTFFDLKKNVRRRHEAAFCSVDLRFST